MRTSIPLVLLSLIVIGRRNNSLAKTLIGFGLTYSIEIARFAVPDLALAAQQSDLATTAYFAAHLAVAAAIVLSGFWILLATKRTPVPRPK